ncbi:MAG: chorismate mutase [Myxococcales bacterium]|nr:chorismate mutase [Myxococcales bacterium]
MPKDLAELRQRLDAIDEALIQALAQREAVSQEVARLKMGGKHALRDHAREAEILTTLIKRARSAGLDATFVTRLYREIFDHSIRMQQDLMSHGESSAELQQSAQVVAFQGSEGSYTHSAAMKHFGVRANSIVFEGYTTTDEVVEATLTGAADFAVLPLESTMAGSFSDTYAVLEDRDLKIVGEEIQRLEHCLVTLDDIPINRVRHIYSQPPAFDHCKRFLRTLKHVRLEAYPDTALAAQRVRNDEDLSQAAIASSEAAKLHGLYVLKRNISDLADLYTRMIVVAQQPLKVDIGVPCKTSLSFTTKHVEGALANCLAVLAEHGCNLTKIRSRPMPTAAWQYMFYVEFDGNIAEENVQSALTDMAGQTESLRILGSYPARTVLEANPATPIDG